MNYVNRWSLAYNRLTPITHQDFYSSSSFHGNSLKRQAAFMLTLFKMIQCLYLQVNMYWPAFIYIYIYKCLHIIFRSGLHILYLVHILKHCRFEKIYRLDIFRLYSIPPSTQRSRLCPIKNIQVHKQTQIHLFCRNKLHFVKNVRFGASQRILSYTCRQSWVLTECEFILGAAVMVMSGNEEASGSALNLTFSLKHKI